MSLSQLNSQNTVICYVTNRTHRDLLLERAERVNFSTEESDFQASARLGLDEVDRPYAFLVVGGDGETCFGFAKPYSDVARLGFEVTYQEMLDRTSPALRVAAPKPVEPEWPKVFTFYDSHTSVELRFFKDGSLRIKAGNQTWANGDFGGTRHLRDFLNSFSENLS